jgi:hypothetical protein
MIHTKTQKNNRGKRVQKKRVKLMISDSTLEDFDADSKTINQYGGTGTASSSSSSSSASSSARAPTQAEKDDLIVRKLGNFTRMQQWAKSDTEVKNLKKQIRGYYILPEYKDTTGKTYDRHSTIPKMENYLSDNEMKKIFEQIEGVIYNPAGSDSCKTPEGVDRQTNISDFCALYVSAHGNDLDITYRTTLIDSMLSLLFEFKDDTGILSDETYFSVLKIIFGNEIKFKNEFMSYLQTNVYLEIALGLPGPSAPMSGVGLEEEKRGSRWWSFSSSENDIALVLNTFCLLKQFIKTSNPRYIPTMCFLIELSRIMRYQLRGNFNQTWSEQCVDDECDAWEKEYLKLLYKNNIWVQKRLNEFTKDRYYQLKPNPDDNPDNKVHDGLYLSLLTGTNGIPIELGTPPAPPRTGVSRYLSRAPAAPDPDPCDSLDPFLKEKERMQNEFIEKRDKYLEKIISDGRVVSSSSEEEEKQLALDIYHQECDNITRKIMEKTDIENMPKRTKKEKTERDQAIATVKAELEAMKNKMSYIENGNTVYITREKVAVLDTPNTELEAFSLKPFHGTKAPNKTTIIKFKEYVDSRVQYLYPGDTNKQNAIKKAIKQGIMHSIDKGELYLSEICLLGFLLKLKLQLWDPACRPLEHTVRIRGKDKSIELVGDKAEAQETFLGSPPTLSRQFSFSAYG